MVSIWGSRESSGFLEMRFLLSPIPRSGRYAIAPLSKTVSKVEVSSSESRR